MLELVWDFLWRYQWLCIGMVGLICCIALLFVFFKVGDYWLQAYMCGADISLASLIVMELLDVDTKAIVNAKIMATQSGLSIDRLNGASTEKFVAHQLSGGDIARVVQACVAAKQADMELDFQRASLIDLSGRDVLKAVQTSISPRIIRCPQDDRDANKLLSAVAKNGIELRVDARVTVRTQLDRLIGGTTEETLIARIGQAIIAEIGSAESHLDVLAMPSNISKRAMQNDLDKNSSFSIVSIDIYHLVVGENIGARLRGDQADADIRVAVAHAEGRRAEAVATTQQMKARIAQRRAEKLRAEANIPSAIASTFSQRYGLSRPFHKSNTIIDESRTATGDTVSPPQARLNTTL